jgi:hypothetical protein
VNEICKWGHDGLVSVVFCLKNRVVPDFHSKSQKFMNTLSAMEEMKEIKEKLNDVRNRFMVRFLYLDTIK